MSARCSSWVWHEAPINDLATLVVMLALADEADDNGLFCFAGLRRLAAKARSSPSTVKNATDRMHEAGLVTVVRPDQPAPGRPNHYLLHVPWQDPAEVAAYVAAIGYVVDLDPADCAARAQSQSDPTARQPRGTARNRAPQGRAVPRATARPHGARVPIDPVVTNPGGSAFLPGTGWVPTPEKQAEVEAGLPAEGIERLRRARQGLDPTLIPTTTQGEQTP